jgi:LysR family transcriptional regulator, regulator for bpeEF and oprC
MDGFAEIAVFTRVVDAHSFTAAARSLALTPSGVSRVIARLERRLGVQLLQRTTRSLGLTDDGAAYYERCKRILVDLEDAEDVLARGRQEPRGRLRVDAPVVLGRFVLGPALPGFLDAHRELAVDLSVRDHVIDPIALGIDVTLRLAVLRDSELVSRTLGALRMVVVGSPRYFAQHGRPRVPADLARHALIGFLSGGATRPWRFRDERELAVGGRLRTDSADAAREAALAGHGLVHVFALHVADELARGSLEAVLVDHERPPRPVHALYARHRAATPKVRVFLDWAAQQIADREQLATRAGAISRPRTRTTTRSARSRRRA